MNTIKIYLDTDGSVRDLQKDFDLYQYEYQNKLINIFVPTSILARFVSDDQQVGYSCQLKMSAVTSGGIPTLTANFNTRYVKNVVTNGIEYALFERLMPYAFTIYSGVGANAPQLTISVVNVKLEEGEDPQVLSIISSQVCPLDVNASTQVEEEPIESTDVETLFALYNGLVATMATKQDKVDEQINPDGDNHSVKDNINYLLERDGDLADVEEQVRQNTEDIEDLKIIETFGLDIVGTMVIKSQSAEDDNKLPTKEELDTFIENITGESEVKKGQAVFIHWDNYAVADKTALCLWNGTQYSYLDMTLRKAGNSVLGEIEGTYEVSGLNVANNFMVDIVAGQIKNIYRVNADGESIDLKTALDQVKGKLVDGKPVTRAIADKNGNDIYDTYQTKSEGATKLYVQQYATPRALLELNYPDYATGAFKKVEATDNSYNKAVASSSTGYTQLASLIKSLEADILLGNQNGVKNRIWLIADVTENIKLSVSTSYLDEDNNEVYLSIQNTDWISLTSGNARLIEIESVFDGLTDPITLPSGTTIRQQITLYRESSASATFTLLSNTTYNAYMSLNKIGYVRYNVSSVPQGITMGNDTATLDGNNNLVVSGNGEMEFEGGNSEPIATQFKVPMASGLNDPTEIRPPKAGVVGSALKGKFSIYELDGGLIGTTISNDLKTLLTTNPRPIIYFNNQYYLPTTSASTIWYWDLVNPDVTTGVLKTIYINGNTLDVTTANYPTIPQSNNSYASISAVGQEYDPTQTYNQYSTCRHNGKAYYRHSTTPATGAWSDVGWTEFTMGQLFYVTRDLDDKKLDKQTGVTSYNQAYVKNADGTQSMFNISTSAVGNNIVRRDGSGQIAVPTTPTDNAHATSKQYVDTNLADKLANKGEVEFNQISKNINVNQDFASGGVSEGSQFYVNINLVENPTIVSGHKYYVFGKINSATNVSSIRVYYNTNAGAFSLTTTPNAEIITIYNLSLYRVYKATTSEANANYTLNLIDLTTMFGSGQEPDLATCQAIFSADYYAYESGKTCMLVADNSNNACFIPKDQIVGMRDITPTLLWENPSPTSNFSAQTITTRDMQSYKYLLIVFSANNQSGDNQREQYIEKMVNFPNQQFGIRLFNTNGTVIHYRYALCSGTTSIQFNDATSGGTTDNTRIIPIAIYGTNNL